MTGDPTPLMPPGNLPRRPASADLAGFAPRLRSAPPPLDPDVREVAGTLHRAAATAEDYRHQVGRRARLARAGLALTQGAVAARAGVTRNFVSAIERGVQGLDAWRLGKLADALGVTPGWLLGHSDDPGCQPAAGRPTLARRG